jgi:hypothetical protein
VNSSYLSKRRDDKAGKGERKKQMARMNIALVRRQLNLRKDPALELEQSNQTSLWYSSRQVSGCMVAEGVR